MISRKNCSPSILAKLLLNSTERWSCAVKEITGKNKIDKAIEKTHPFALHSKKEKRKDVHRLGYISMVDLNLSRWTRF